MRTRAHVRPGRGASASGMVVGLIFVGLGIFVAIPTFGGFGVVWTLVAVIMTVVHGMNTFSENGVASHVVEYETFQPPPTQSPSPPPAPPARPASTHPMVPPPETIEERLARLETLRDRGLVSPEEYAEQRDRILDSI